MQGELPTDVIELWQRQATDGFQMTADEIRRRLETMERKSRRGRYGAFVALTLSAIVVITLAAIAPNTVQSIGAVLIVLGLAFVSYQIHRTRAQDAPSMKMDSVASIEFHRALLQRQLEFHSTGLWPRVLALAPGGLLFFSGLAAAQPKLAVLAYLQIATFAVAIIAMIPLNRRMAVRYRLQIEELGRLQNDPGA
jgi:hypothetical protein